MKRIIQLVVVIISINMHTMPATEGAWLNWKGYRTFFPSVRAEGSSKPLLHESKNNGRSWWVKLFKPVSQNALESKVDARLAKKRDESMQLASRDEGIKNKVLELSNTSKSNEKSWLSRLLAPFSYSALAIKANAALARKRDEAARRMALDEEVKNKVLQSTIDKQNSKIAWSERRYRHNPTEVNKRYYENNKEIGGALVQYGGKIYDDVKKNGSSALLLQVFSLEAIGDIRKNDNINNVVNELKSERSRLEKEMMPAPALSSDA